MRLMLLFLLCALPVTASAHVLDEYLQAAQISLAPDGVRVNLRLIPGVKVAERIFALIDVDGDGQISPEEEQAYAQLVTGDIALETDGRKMPFVLKDIRFPPRDKMNEGNGAIRLDLAADMKLDRAGEHQITFRNDHLPDIGVYLANVLISTADTIEITGQQRDNLQHELRVNFRVHSANTPASSQWKALLIGLFLLLLSAQWKCLRFFFQGLNGGKMCR